MKRVLSTGLLGLVLACGDTGQARVSVALTATGSAAESVTIADATVMLTRADVALGPLYFCASAIGRAELCEVAVAELLPVVVLHGLDPTPQALGALDATTGNIMSAIYDYGISWLLTQNQPRASTSALDGHSAVLEGVIMRGGRTLRFSAQIDALPRVAGDQTVNGQRTSHALVSHTEQLTLTVDPNRWVDRLDVEALFARDTDGDGVVTIAPADSAAEASHMLPGVPDGGSSDAGSAAREVDTSYESILQGMTTRAPLGFVWH